MRQTTDAGAALTDRTGNNIGEGVMKKEHGL